MFMMLSRPERSHVVILNVTPELVNLVISEMYYLYKVLLNTLTSCRLLIPIYLYGRNAFVLVYVLNEQ